MGRPPTARRTTSPLHRPSTARYRSTSRDERPQDEVRRRLPLHLLLKAWTEYAAGEDLSESTIKSYRYYLLRFVADQVVEPHDATTQHLSGFLAGMGDRGPSKGQAKRALRHLFRWMRASGLRPDDPTEILGKTRHRRPAPDYLTEEELARLVYTAACHRAEWAWAIVFIYVTGARVGEACGVRPSDVDLATQTVTLRRTKNGWDRVVPLGRTGMAAALALMDGRPTLLGVSPSAIRERLTKLRILTRLPRRKVHPHALRHTCGTHLSERGASQPQVMAHLGHIDPAMSAWYVHVSSARGRATANLL